MFRFYFVRKDKGIATLHDGLHPSICLSIAVNAIEKEDFPIADI